LHSQNSTPLYLTITNIYLNIVKLKIISYLWLHVRLTLKPIAGLRLKE
jgi:hypothetical protein